MILLISAIAIENCFEKVFEMCYQPSYLEMALYNLLVSVSLKILEIV